MSGLNLQQQAALNAMLDFIDDGYESYFLLSGYAGTGKTYTIQRLINEINGVNIIFTAPTHKAVKVLESMAMNEGLDVCCCTIHSLLGLKVSNVGHKQVIKRAVPLGDLQRFRNGRTVIVVDECSMIGNELFNFINEDANCEKYKLQFIFMGDPAQLPPVNELVSPVFGCTELSAGLTEVMRQRSQNPILGLCTDVRNGVFGNIKSEMSYDGSCGVRVVGGDSFLKLINSAFIIDGYGDDPDRVRVVAWRNDRVNAINDYIHNLRYPDCKSWLAPGEPVTFVKPLFNGSLIMPDLGSKADDIIVNTDFEAVVLSCVRINKMGFNAWVVEVDTCLGGRYKFYALDSLGLKELDKELDNIRSSILSKEKDKGGYTWRDYYALRDFFAYIRPAYCLTVHKSQGSTFRSVFVDAGDILLNKNFYEMNKCLYVAFSRASNFLIVMG